MVRRGVFAAAMLWAGAATAEPEREPLVFVADSKLGVETTVRTFDSVGRIVMRYEEALPRFGLDDTTPVGTAVGIVGRALRLAFLDEPLAELITVSTHEVGGHGGRGRELHLDPTFLFYLPGVYRPLFSPHDRDPSAAFTTFGTQDIVEEPRSTLATLGGLEANFTQAWWINARIVRQDGWAHYGDLLVYGLAKVVYADTFFSPSLRRNGGESSSDVASYITELQESANRWRPRDRRTLATHISRGYIWNLVDPMLLYAAYGTVVHTLVRGERSAQAPLPKIWDHTLLVTPRYNLSPFGPEQGADVMLGHEHAFFDLYARVGTSGITSYYGAGARVLGVPVFDRLTIGGELDMWRQPDLELGERADYDHHQRIGINAGIFADVQLTDVVSLTGKIAGKTEGYVQALPVARGLHGYGGVSIAW